MLYVDDVMLAVTNRNDLQLQVQTWIDRLNHFGLHLYIKKTEYLLSITTHGVQQIKKT